MDKRLKNPPKNKTQLTHPSELAKKLEVLIGQKFILTGKSRTDGSNIRKLVGATLLSNKPPIGSAQNDYKVIPTKGVPKNRLEFVDTFIVTSGRSYNLQVWNRNPTSDSIQIEYSNGDTLRAREVRFVFVKIDTEKNIVETIAVLTPDYIVQNFGSFGKPTIKSQLIISAKSRQAILLKPNKLLFNPDDGNVGNESNIKDLSKFSIHTPPTSESLLPLSKIKDIVIDKIIGQAISPAATKNRGQMLEEVMAFALGYSINDDELLAGGYPDIRNQALEIKIQDSPTVDLGKYSPEYDEVIPNCNGFTTRTMRYFIALSNASTNIIEGAILCPGGILEKHFTFVPEESYKVQRSISMSFFENIRGQSVFNP